MTPPHRPLIGTVVIGRNEGQRLVQCLTSLKGTANHIVYVDSGSSDDSVATARRLGARVLLLDSDKPFTAARARNAGFEQLINGSEPVDYVQFIDGDCELRSTWLTTACGFLDSHPKAAIACGRLRERHPEASVYNRLADAEWNTPVGQIKACGGIMMVRADTFADIGGFNPDMIAGEEPELCVRLRHAGWLIWRLDAEMAWHDAAMMRFGQWWRRTRRAGHTYAQGVAMHGRTPERHNITQTRRALIWGAGLPLLSLLGCLVTPWALLLLLAWPLQIVRLARRGVSWERAFFLTLGKIPESLGILGYGWRRLIGAKNTLIEYK